jgi:hypothetical protein
MRVTVETIIGLFASGRSEQDALQAYPCLEAEDLRAVLAYRADYTAQRDRGLGTPSVDELTDETERRRKDPPTK